MKISRTVKSKLIVFVVLIAVSFPLFSLELISGGIIFLIGSIIFGFWNSWMDIINSIWEKFSGSKSKV